MNLEFLQHSPSKTISYNIYINPFKIPYYLKDSSFASWVKEKELQTEDKSFLREFLPSSLVPKNKISVLELSKLGHSIKHIGLDNGNQQEPIIIPSNTNIPPQCGIYYFEMKIISKGKEGLISIGLSTPESKLSNHLGIEANSWGFHLYDGSIFSSSPDGTAYGSKCTTGDVVGCGVNFNNNTVFFTKNGANLGTAFKEIKGNLIPSISLQSVGEHVEMNFGQHPFKYEIGLYLDEEKYTLWEKIKQTPITFPQNDLSNAQAGQSKQNDASTDHTDATVNFLIASYLIHNGYISTAKAFIKDSMGISINGDENSNKIKLGTQTFGTSIVKKIMEELTQANENDIRTREKIRNYTLSGDIEAAIKLTVETYPTVFTGNPDILFRLKCRRFIEIIRDLENLNNSTSNTAIQDSSLEKRKRDPQSSLEYEGQGSKKVSIETALNYGNELHKEYGQTQNPEIKKTLMETFSLLVYLQPSKSELSHLLDVSLREKLAESLNSAILTSQGKAPTSPLELLYRHTYVINRYMVEYGIGEGSLINLKKDCL